MAGARRSDHEQAVRRHAAGESFAALAREYGVTMSAVSQAVARATDSVWRERQNAYHRVYQREYKRVPCKAGCGALVWTRTWLPQAERWTGLCPRCLGVQRTVTVRPGTLRCSECHAWKPDVQFPSSVKEQARRLRHRVCRGCQAAARQRSRLARRVPCLSCGRPRLHPKDAGRSHGHADTGLCLACYRGSPEHLAALAKGRRKRLSGQALG